MFDEYQRITREDMKMACFFDDIFKGFGEKIGAWICFLLETGAWFCLEKLTSELQSSMENNYFLFLVSRFCFSFVLFCFFFFDTWVRSICGHVCTTRRSKGTRHRGMKETLFLFLV